MKSTKSLSAVWLVAVLLTLTAVVACEPDGSGVPSPGIEIHLDAAGTIVPSKTVHTPGVLGEDFHVTIYDHAGTIVKSERISGLTTAADVFGLMSPEERAKAVSEIAPVATSLRENLPFVDQEAVSRAVQMLTKDLSPEEREQVLRSVEQQEKSK